MLGITLGEHIKDYIEFLGINQSDLADRLGVSKKHINELLNGKKQFTNEMLIAMSLILDMDINFMIKLLANNQIKNEIEQNFKDAHEIKRFLKDNKFDEAVNKKWFKMQYDDPYVKIKNLMEYIRMPKLTEINKVKAKVFFKSKKENDIKVLMWLERCSLLAREQEIGEYNSKNINALVSEIKEEALTETFNPEKITNILNKYGIKFVFEDALTGSNTRGAFRVLGNTPHIYLTSFNKKISSYYFALLHEIAHCKTDFNKAKSCVLMEVDDTCEHKADEKALEWMIPNKIWKIIKNDLNVESTSNDFKIPTSFIVARMAMMGIISYKDPVYINNIK